MPVQKIHPQPLLPLPQACMCLRKVYKRSVHQPARSMSTLQRWAAPVRQPRVCMRQAAGRKPMVQSRGGRSSGRRMAYLPALQRSE